MFKFPKDEQESWLVGMTRSQKSKAQWPTTNQHLKGV